jgi:hypothetical protein
MTQTPSTPAGWYPQGDVQRWWDGNAWTDHTQPMPGVAPQPTVQQPVQPAYGAQPAYGSPQTYYPQQPPQKSHTARNVLIVIGVLFLVLVGGCLAAVVVVGDKVNEAVNDDTVGGPNNPLTIEPGKAFEVDGYEYDDGWTLDKDASGLVRVQGLKVTNNRGKADRAIVDIKLYLGNEVLATANCNNGIDKIPEGVKVTLSCSSSDAFPEQYDKVTINDIA